MLLIFLQTEIHAPIEKVFDLARSIETHVASTAESNERAVGGRTSGMIELGDTITWEARHFWIRQRLTVEITRFDRPHLFEDQMLSGAFASMRHVHRFQAAQFGTLMSDEFHFEAPFRLLGRIAERFFLTRYMTNFLQTRNDFLKTIAESEDH